MKAKHDSENEPPEKRTPITVETTTKSPVNKGFDFSIPSGSHDGFAFSTPNFSATIAGNSDPGESINPFVFKSRSQSSPGDFLVYFSHPHSRLREKFNAQSLINFIFIFLGSDKYNLEKNDVSPKYSKVHSKDRVAKDREREGSGKFSALQKWLRGDDKGDKRSSGR